MPRPERPLDETAGELAGFARGLRRLRESAGSPGYRQLGVRAHYSASTLAEAAGGRRMPSLDVTLAYVRACGGDPDEWEERWHALAEAVVPGTNRRVPYVGLASFRAEDADWFFGRDRLVEHLVTRVAERRFVAVFGASGSGKSSLLGAGLVAAARAGRLGEEGDWAVATMTPGALPALPELTGDRRLLVVDQFEEVFTLCPDAERARFVDALLAAAEDGTHVVIAVRTDFYTHCSAHARLAEALRDNQVLVGAMTTEELRRAVVQPAVRAGYTVEGSLVTELVAEAAGRPGMLPLVSHALMETFQRRRGTTLTLEAYQAAGGIRGAAARTAEDTYATLTGPQQELARDVFLRLTALGEGTEDTKRRIELDELDAGADLDAILEAYVRARLVTIDGRTIEIAHEALIRSWPRLRGWLAEDRDGLRVHRQLTEASAIWESLDRDPGALYRGIRLATARDWSADHRLGSREAAFLEASTAADRDERQRTHRHNRQLRWLALALTILLLAAVGISVIALGQRQEAVTQQRIAQSRQLAAQAEGVAPKDAGKAIRWALEAYAAHPTAEARSILLSLASRPTHTARLPRSGVPNRRVGYSVDGRMLASSDRDGEEVVLWDTTTRTRVFTLPRSGRVQHLDYAFSRDGTRFATAARNRDVTIWSLVDGSRVERYPVGPDTSDIAIDPNLQLVASVDRDGTVRIREGRRGGTLELWHGPTGVGSTLTFSSDGRTLAVAGQGGAITLWDTETGARRDIQGAGSLTSITFDASGRTLATSAVNGDITLWDVASGVPRTRLSGSGGRINGLAFHPTSPVLVATTHDRVVFWDTSRRLRLTQLETDESGLGMPVFDPDGDTLAVPADEATLLWHRDDLPLMGLTDTPASLVYRTDGELLSLGARELTTWDVSARAITTRRGVGPYTVSSFGADRSRLVLGSGGELTLWELATGNHERIPFAYEYGAIAVNPDRSVLAVAAVDGAVTLWSLARSRQVGVISPPRVPARTVDDMTFLPDGRTLAIRSNLRPLELWDVDTRSRVGELRLPDDTKLMAADASSTVLATAGTGGVVQLWDLRTRTHLGDLNGHTGGITALAFPGDGNLLATTGTDDKVILWDLTTRTRWATLSGHTDDVRGATWRPDGTRLATGSDDNTITIWTTDPESAMTHLCRRLTQDFPMAATPTPDAC